MIVARAPAKKSAEPVSSAAKKSAAASIPGRLRLAALVGSPAAAFAALSGPALAAASDFQDLLDASASDDSAFQARLHFLDSPILQTNISPP